MLSKTCVKAALLLIPPEAAPYPISSLMFVMPSASGSQSAFVWVVVAVLLLHSVGQCWNKIFCRTCLRGQWVIPAALLQASLAASQGWLHSVPWDTVPAAEHMAQLAFTPASFTESTSGRETMARGFPRRVMMALAMVSIYRQPRITRNAGYGKGQHDPHELQQLLLGIAGVMGWRISSL